VDIDSQAVTATRRNAARNNVAKRLQASTSLPDVAQRFDVVVANILAGTLIDNADTIIGLTKPAGRIALSGILSEQCADVVAAFGELVTWEMRTSRDGWVILVASRTGD
jgi:ribosomal protein L11 methyltransferase